MAKSKGIDEKLADELGRYIARYHFDLSPLQAYQSGERCWAKQIEGVILSLEENLSGYDKNNIDILVKDVIAYLKAKFGQVKPSLEVRGKSGAIRRCHGDLHLNNIVFLDGKPCPFDALEFDEDLAQVDVLYDLSFLLMDLLNLGLKQEANLVFNRYLCESWKLVFKDGVSVLPLYLALRASIRAMVSLQCGEGDTQKARHYLELARDVLQARAPYLIAVRGLSGSGKSTLAVKLAAQIKDPLGAVLLRSDVERKKLFGVSEFEHLPAVTYDQHSSELVYNQLLEKAESLLTQGQSVILDAVFLNPDERDGAEQLAKDLNVTFKGLSLDAPLDVLLKRVSGRVRDASDAGPDVVSKQYNSLHSQGEQFGEGWVLLDASGTKAETLTAALELL